MEYQNAPNVFFVVVEKYIILLLFEIIAIGQNIDFEVLYFPWLFRFTKSKNINYNFTACDKVVDGTKLEIISHIFFNIMIPLSLAHTLYD